MTTNEDAWKLYGRYVEAWKAVPEEDRARIVDEVLEPTVRYSTPQLELGGRDAVIEDMAGFQEKFPGGRFDVGDVSAHHDVALLTWILVQADGSVFAKGHDQIRVSPGGKIASITTFAPSVTNP